MANEKIERKYLAHFVDANFNANADSLETGASLNYVRLGKDLEAFAIELNPQVEVKKNILGEQNVIHNGYESQSSADTFYCYYGDPLYENLLEVANERKTGDGCRTTRVDALYHLGDNDALVCDWAYREDCWLVPQSVGGDTSGVQIPFTIYDNGNRKAGTMTQDAQTHAWTFAAS